MPALANKASAGAVSGNRTERSTDRLTLELTLLALMHAVA